MDKKKNMGAIAFGLAVFLGVSFPALADEEVDQANNYTDEYIEYDDTNLDEYYGLKEDFIDTIYNENAEPVKIDAVKPVEKQVVAETVSYKPATERAEVKAPERAEVKAPEKTVAKVEKKPENTIKAFDGLTKLSQNEIDYLSPTFKTNLSEEELTAVINKAFPKNKLIKDNDPVLVRDFVKTLCEIERRLGISPYFILGIINAENPIMNGSFSKIVKDKNNLMSRNCYDDDPYGKSSKFETYADAIVLPAKFLRINYLDPKGMYYVDGTVKGVNKYYATAQNRNKNVTYGMDRLFQARQALLA